MYAEAYQMFLTGKVPWYVVSILRISSLDEREHTTSYDSHADNHGAIGLLNVVFWLGIEYIIRKGFGIARMKFEKGLLAGGIYIYGAKWGVLLAVPEVDIFAIYQFM